MFLKCVFSPGLPPARGAAREALVLLIQSRALDVLLLRPHQLMVVIMIIIIITASTDEDEHHHRIN